MGFRATPSAGSTNPRGSGYAAASERNGVEKRWPTRSNSGAWCGRRRSRGEWSASSTPLSPVRPLPTRARLSFDLSAFATLGRVRIELSTMLLLEQPEPAPSKTSPALIVAPYAVHDASIADFAKGHSIAMALAEGGPHRLALTFLKSATAEMRDFGIDDYLADLNVAVDDLGGRASLIGLCQGGWLAAAYAARFPKKVAKLVLAGAPIDPGAAESGITQALASVPPETIQQMVALGGGRISGSLSFALWSDGLSPEFTAEAALQRCVTPRSWRSSTSGT